MKPTAKDEQTLEAIRNWIDDRGFSPTRRDLAQVLGIAVGTAQARLERLQELGLIEVVGGRRALIRIVEWDD